MKRICVFAGSNPGNRPEYQEAAVQLGQELVKNGVELVYGGGGAGLMGVVANTVLKMGGNVTGVMPSFLSSREAAHPNLTRFYEVKDMHARKAKMGELSDAFIALPGGYGTFEEIFEFVSHGQLGLHRKPVGLLNVAGYYQPLMKMIDKGVEEGFISSSHRGRIICEEQPAQLTKKLLIR